MSHVAAQRSSPRIGLVLMAVLVVVVAVGLFVTQKKWLPPLRSWLAVPAAKSGEEEHAHEHHEHADPNSIKLSEQARKNIGLELTQVKLEPFKRTIAVPGIVAERPGESTVEVPAPLTGVITQVFATPGAAVRPGDKLFEIRLTHEELVQAQAELLKTVEQLDVIDREIKRLEKVSADGAIARKTLLERTYEQQQQKAAQRSQSEALRLHGFDQTQIDRIISDRKLLSTLTIVVPGSASGDDGPLYQVQDLQVNRGQHVEAGATLAILANHAELMIEGNAFERDLPAITRTVEEGWPITAVIKGTDGQEQVVPDLKVLYVAGKVDSVERTLHFYVGLPNVLTKSVSAASGGTNYVNWRFRPGQRLQLLAPVETWEKRIVLPTGAVAQEGAESYVFVPSGATMKRRPVHVEYRDTRHVVLANDGSIFPGAWVATSGAQQLQIALKNQAGGAVDPHAGHNH